VNHSASPITSLVPSFLRVGFGSEDPIVDLCFDSTRNWLYTLSASSAVTLYDLDEGRGVICDSEGERNKEEREERDQGDLENDREKK
jgi:hypothetical protein